MCACDLMSCICVYVIECVPCGCACRVYVCMCARLQVHSVDILKILENDSIHGPVAAGRLASHHASWDKFRHQKHDLFLSRNDTRDYFLTDVSNQPSRLLKNVAVSIIICQCAVIVVCRDAMVARHCAVVFPYARADSVVVAPPGHRMFFFSFAGSRWTEEGFPVFLDGDCVYAFMYVGVPVDTSACMCM